jgi:O-antigen/teichoic acid export membrane protein
VAETLLSQEEERAAGQPSLFSGRLLARNTIWNLVGQGAPMVAALFCIPRLIHGLGVDRFGVLTLAWMVTGYFSLFDFGLGRALTKLVAERLGTEKESTIAGLVWTALSLMLLLGTIGALVLALFTPALVTSVFKIPAGLHAETRTAFYLLDLSIPIVISATSLRGILEAQQKFAVLTYVRIPMGVFTFAGPVIALAFSRSLAVVVGVLVMGRVVAWVAHFVLCQHNMPALRSRIRFERADVRPLLSFGGWMTVSNVISPLMVYLDRFMIGALISMSAVAYYATPLEVVTKLRMVWRLAHDDLDDGRKENERLVQRRKDHQVAGYWSDRYVARLGRMRSGT